MELLNKKDYAEVVDFECGCCVEMESKRSKYPKWVVVSFCDEHDPTVNHD